MALDNIKISDLPTAESITDNSLIELALEAPDGSEVPYLSRKTTIGNLTNYTGGISLTHGGGPHNSIFRGKFLGTAPTADQYEAIRRGTFYYENPTTHEISDIYVGDYWYDETENVHWRVAALDYYYNTNKPGQQVARTEHHVVIVPDEPLFFNTPMNMRKLSPVGSVEYPESSENGGYYYSYMRGYVDKTETFNGDGSAVYWTTTQIVGRPVSVKCYDANNEEIDIEDVLWYMSVVYNNLKRFNCKVKLNGGTSFVALPSGYHVDFTYKYKNTSYSGKDNYMPLMGLVECQTKINTKFGSNHIMPFTIVADKGRNDECPNPNYANYKTSSKGYSSAMTDSTSVELMSEIQMTGRVTFGIEARYQNDKQIGTYDAQENPLYFYESHGGYGNNESIFPLFLYNPNLRANRCNYWLRDLVNADYDGMINDGISTKGRYCFLKQVADGQGISYTLGSKPGGYWNYDNVASLSNINTRPFFCIYNGEEYS